ncbi:hypothetical protein ANN_26450 [Periplaneta americana]|uniref:Uncharacterized protein n=1 Tax=Periplaneta americana TaxID=6978 RepID=A0ABQ8RYC2_PERAM|nr:hypothetical protein ANN_26450 [Periplaneta americana]
MSFLRIGARERFRAQESLSASQRKGKRQTKEVIISRSMSTFVSRKKSTLSRLRTSHNLRSIAQVDADDLRKSEVVSYQSIWHVPCRPSFVYLASTAAYKTNEPRSVHSNIATQ